MVYAEKVSKEGLSPPESYRQLVEMERENINRFSSVIQAIPDAHYVDLVAPLRDLGADLQQFQSDGVTLGFGELSSL